MSIFRFFVRFLPLGRRKVNDGHIHLERKILDGNLAPRGRFSRFEAWIWLLLNANWRDGKWLGITVKRGELITSQLKLADKWGWGIASVNRFLNELKTENRIEIKTTNNFTHIKILKYNEKNGILESKMENGWKTDGKRMETIEEENKKRRKEKNNILALKCPEANEILKFYKETYGFKKNVPKQIENWRAAKWLYEQYGVEKTCQAILAAKSALEESVSGVDKVPLIKNLMDLKEKYDQLRAYYGRKIARRGKNIDLSKL